MTTDIKAANFETTQHWPDTFPARAVTEAQPKETEKEQFDHYVENGKLAWDNEIL